MNKDQVLMKMAEARDRIRASEAYRDYEQRITTRVLHAAECGLEALILNSSGTPRDPSIHQTLMDDLAYNGFDVSEDENFIIIRWYEIGKE